MLKQKQIFSQNKKENACSTNPCYNGGTCTVSLVGQAVCICSAGFTGYYCQTPISCGSLLNCQNGGSCRYSNGAYSCLCPANVYGATCQYKVTTATCYSGDNNPTSCPMYKQQGFCSFTYSYNSGIFLLIFKRFLKHIKFNW